MKRSPSIFLSIQTHSNFRVSSKIPVPTSRPDHGADLVGSLIFHRFSSLGIHLLSASRINRIVIPEFVVQGVLCAVFLITWHWFMFLMTVPLACYHVMLFLKRQHLFDVTEAFRFLNAEKKFRMIKLGFYLALFAIITFRLALSVFNFLSDAEDAVHLF
ncbi:hypothetical protein F2P56_009947 [Juglans regia]|uniref:Protein cornichon homolog 1-like isoform X1 n=2 Tax=Juglans regia TaxID=51240 RepID=A0A2I4G4B1_JUGRE|nr:protein cornichon homolog 1-like isoform X1 [Juglans regia]XP_035544939.1 protein cornichon homolog 1-like isoform X1 [Juglans regia]KAF5473328.1 hypothetical protein F2P56_009947 [Juglans regia]